MLSVNFFKVIKMDERKDLILKPGKKIDILLKKEKKKKKLV